MASMPASAGASSGKRRRISSRISAEALDALALQQQDDLWRAQLEWVNAKLREDPSLMPRVLGCLRSTGPIPQPFFPACVRRFLKIRKEKCIELLGEIEPHCQSMNLANLHDITDLRWALAWCLEASIHDKIPNRHTKESFMSFAKPRYLAAGSRLNHFYLGAGGESVDWVTKWGAYSLVKGEGAEDSGKYTHIQHDASGAKVPVPCGAIEVSDLQSWQIDANYQDDHAKLKNDASGMEQKLNCLFKSQIESLKLEAIGDVGDDEADDDFEGGGASCAAGSGTNPATPHTKPNSSPTKPVASPSPGPSPAGGSPGSEDVANAILGATIKLKPPQRRRNSGIVPPPPPAF